MQRPGMEQAVNSLVSLLKQRLQPAMDRAAKSFDEPAPPSADDKIHQAKLVPEDEQQTAGRSASDIDEEPH